MKKLFIGEQYNDDAADFTKKIHSATKDIIYDMLMEGYLAQEVEYLADAGIKSAFYSSVIQFGAFLYEAGQADPTEEDIYEVTQIASIMAKGLREMDDETYEKLNEERES